MDVCLRQPQAYAVMTVAPKPSRGRWTLCGVLAAGSAQDVNQVLLDVGEHLLNWYIASQFLAERGHAGVGDAAGHDHLGPGQVTAAVECETVHRDVLAHPDTDGADLAVGSGLVGLDPHSASALHSRSGDPQVCTDPDHHLLEATHVGHDVNRGGEPDDRVADQLAWTVPGDLAAAVHIDDRGAVKGPLMRFGPLAGGVDRGMLQKQHGIGFLAGNHGGVKLALTVPCSHVVDVVRGKSQLLETHAARVRGPWACLSKR